MKQQNYYARGPPFCLAGVKLREVYVSSTHFQKGHHMKVLYINNDGGGFADYVEVAEGTSVEKFWGERLQGRRPEDYLIRINRQPVSRDLIIEEGDRVSITPTKIEGASLL